MSFLEALQAKRHQLKQNSKTVVTTASGQQYVENIKTQEKYKLEQGNAYGFVVDTKPDLIPACVLEGFLYMGSQDAVSLENITKYALTHILSVGIMCPLSDLGDNIKNLYVPCLDLPATSLLGNVFKSSFQFIEDARRINGRVLVHCNAGVSRSSSVVIAYLMRYRNMDYESALNYVKERRACIRPNAGFRKQLRNFK